MSDCLPSSNGCESVPIVGSVWEVWLHGFDQELIAAGRPASTRNLRAYHIRRLASEHPGRGPAELTRDDLIEWLAVHTWAPEYRRSIRASLRLFYRWARLTERIDRDPAATLPAITPPRSMPRPAPDHALTEALAIRDPRTHQMVELIANTGIRRAECAAVHSRDVVEDLLGYSLRVKGKGGRERMVPLPDHLARQLRAAGGFVFPGKIDGHLSPRRVGELVGEALPGVWTAHTLRHRYATRAYALTRDLRAVQELLGHAKIETTAIYIQVANATLREVARQVWDSGAAA